MIQVPLFYVRRTVTHHWSDNLRAYVVYVLDEYSAQSWEGRDWLDESDLGISVSMSVFPGIVEASEYIRKVVQNA